FDQMPRPNQSRNKGASTTRGTALSILIYGSQPAATNGERARPKPSEIPAAAPTIRPSSDSSTVVARCLQSIPLVTHAATRAAIADGRLMKNGSNSFAATTDSHTDSTAMPTRSRQNNTRVALCVASPLSAVARRNDGRAEVESATSCLRRALALDDFFAQHRPDGAIHVDELRRRTQFHQIARAIELHGMLRHDAAC